MKAISTACPQIQVTNLNYFPFGTVMPLNESTTTAIVASTEPTSIARRLPQLDFLRAVAIVLVLFHHFGSLPRGALPQPILGAFNVLQCGGWSGVDLFFVLSGFLIS